MRDTGERCLTESLSKSAIEHLHRYAFALQYIKNKNVIDIASGEGYGSNLLAVVANRVVGIDISNEAITHAKEKYKRENLYYAQGTADNIPIENNSVDVVVSFETIEHHDKHQEMMNEIKRVLKPDGILIISSPDKLYYSDLPKYSNEYHVKELYLSEFKDLIETNFKESVFFKQKVTYSSLIIPNNSGHYYEFSGGFDKIEKCESIERPVYHIALASQSKINGVFTSSFNGENVFELILQGYYNADYLSKSLDELLNSKTYKIGKLIVTPFRIIKRLIHA